MLDRVREALFSTLGPGIEGAWVLDLFAGSGSLGFEALSRGAAFARFVEEAPRAVAVLKQNAEHLGVVQGVEVMGTNALSPSAWCPPPDQPARWADVVFFDPPYPWLADERRVILFEAVQRLRREVLRAGGLLVFHTPRRGVTELDFERGQAPDRRVYGTSALWYLRGAEDPQEARP
jgi:16S rRNA (guanine966-N2)-methyltransferase